MTQIQLRRGTASAWTTADPVLALGEAGVETDTGKFKIGDGTSLWSELDYIVTAWGDVSGKPAVIAAGADAAAARSAISAASLDGNGKVPGSELPNSIMTYEGLHDVDTNDPTLSDATGSAGEVYRISVGGSRDYGSGSISLGVGDYLIHSGTVWQKADTTDAVSSVAGRTGEVTLTVADVGGDTSTALGVGSVELGHASDTTLSRSAAGVLAVEGVVVPTVSSTSTLSNKRVTPRVGTVASSATPTINTDTVDQFNITALAADITSMTTNLSGTPTDGQRLLIRITDNGTARAITWGASFASSGVATLLATTVVSQTHLVGLIYDSADSKWVCMAVDEAGY